MTISPETIDQIRLATDIVDLVREYIPNLKKVGRNWKTNCPFHNEKTPSFIVNSEKGIFHCFGCNEGGDAFKFVMKMDNLTWPETVKKLANRAGIKLIETKEEVVRRSEKQKIYDIINFACNYYHQALKTTKQGSLAKEYLNKRGVNERSINSFVLGYAPLNGLINVAAKKGYTPEQLSKAGLITKTERGNYFEYMSDRLVFPIIDSQGRVVAFGGRTLRNDEPKYLNTPETSVFSKSVQLYGLYQAIPRLRQNKEVIILEGYMDVVMTHQSGIINTVATLGTALTIYHSNVLNRYAENIIVLFDSDEAGRQAAKRAVEIFIDSDTPSRVVCLPESMDPDEFILKYNRDKFISYIQNKSKSPIEFITELAISKWSIKTPEAKVRTAQEIIPLLNKVKNDILKQEWIGYLAGKLHTTESAIYNELIRENKSKKTNTRNNNLSNKKSIIRTPEEEILQILFSYPEYKKLISEQNFNDKRNKRILSFLNENISPSKIADYLDENDNRWFTELVLEDKFYSDPEQLVNELLKNISNKKLEDQRQELEREVISMMNGEVPSNNSKIQLYNSLNKQLKGSVKNG